MTGGSWGPWVVGAIVAWMLLTAIVSAFVVPSNWTARNVPPHLRADRWELSPDGRRAHELIEKHCGTLGDDAWIDFPRDALQPQLENASDELTTCFETNIAPRFVR